MLYRFLKIWVRLGSFIFCRKIIINDPALLKMNGPLLLACNHPNSFLDAVILDILFRKPVWSLTRGDVFRKPFYQKLLYRFKMLPVYRTSEGVENLESNYGTFDECREIFQNNGIVMMFSEGNCFNEWHLRPLKKGTARLAISSWDAGIDLKILPVGINYSSFRKFGKNIFINFGSIITSEQVKHEIEGKKLNAFTETLKIELSKTVYEIEGNDKPGIEKLIIPVSLFEKIFLFIPALTGWLINASLYIPVYMIAVRKIREKEFHDAVITAILVLIYPFYLLAISLFLYVLTTNYWSFLVWLVFPFTAWCLVRIKRQVD